MSPKMIPRESKVSMITGQYALLDFFGGIIVEDDGPCPSSFRSSLPEITAMLSLLFIVDRSVGQCDRHEFN